MSKIISLTGNMGVGKDTMADYMVEKYGYVKISMADPMKRIAKEIYEFSDEQLWGPSQARNQDDTRYPRADGTFLSARIVAQLLGNELSRLSYPETWIVYMKRVVAKIEAGKGMGGIAVRLVRPALPVDGFLTTGLQNHITETEQLSIPDDFFDRVITVPEGKEAFYKVIDKLIGEL